MMLALVVGEAPSDHYAVELLTHAGIPFQNATLQQVHPERTPLCLLVGHKRLVAEDRSRLRWFVQQGGCVVVIGAANGLENLLGIRTKGKVREGWLRFATPHPIGNDLQSSLHVFGGVIAHVQSGTQVIAHIVNRSGEIIGDAVTVRAVGQGLAIFVAPDLCFSIVHMQQGIAVVKDGVPAPDGSAPIDDGILKAEDGHVLDWEHDRIVLEHPQAGKQVFFGQPIGDELRVLFLQTLLFAAHQKRLPLPMLWYWPKGASAVGLISHDTDGNNPQLGKELLTVVQQLGIPTTWCILYPGGYPSDLYRAILKAGGEIALHFDAFTNTPFTTWSKQNLRLQWQWLKDATGIAAVGNKNHYTRWEGRLEFFRWCEEVGIIAEQSKGPSKRGTVGFLFGGSHPWRPIDDERGRPRFLSVTAINLFSQDMVSNETQPSDYFHPAILPVSVGEELLRQTVRMGGAAHFLFHPAHILQPGTRAALERLVNFGRELGIVWQTSAQIVDWLNRRRAVHQQVRKVGARWVWRLTAPKPLEAARLLHLTPSSDRPITWVYGFPFVERTTHLSGNCEQFLS